MKSVTTTTIGLACVFPLLGQSLAFSQQRHALPPNNPFLIQNSVYPSVHFDPAQTDTTALPVWQGESKIEPSQVQWLPGLTTIGTVHRPYPSGEQAIFFSGGNRVGKIRITGNDSTASRSSSATDSSWRCSSHWELKRASRSNPMHASRRS